MKKQLLLLLFIPFCVAMTSGQCDSNVFFEDMNFKNALLLKTEINTDGNNEISCIEAESYTGGIVVEKKDIGNLTGIEAFINISSLACNQNRLKNLDLSKNTRLTELICFRNELENLDLSNNPELIYLDCHSNKIDNIHVSQNTKLVSLNCRSNKLENIDLINNIELAVLNLEFNQLTDIDVSQNLGLETLRLYFNQLTDIDVSQNVKLVHFSCDSNQLDNIDITGNTELKSFSCGSNQLESIDLSQTLKLERFQCFSNLLTSIDVSQNTKLEALEIEFNELTSIDVSKNPKLKTLYCDFNRLNFLNAKNGTRSITELIAFENPLLGCIEVDDKKAADSGMGNYKNWYIDDSAIYSENCPLLPEKDKTVNFSEQLAANITMYPNPAIDQITITKNANIDLARIYIYRIDGTLAKTVAQTNKNNIQIIPVNDLSKGLYILSIQTQTDKIIRQLFIE